MLLSNKKRFKTFKNVTSYLIFNVVLDCVCLGSAVVRVMDSHSCDRDIILAKGNHIHVINIAIIYIYSVISNVGLHV